MTLSLARRSLTLILLEVQPPHCRDKPIGPIIYVIIFSVLFPFHWRRASRASRFYSNVLYTSLRLDAK